MWSTENAFELYGVERWGAGYFGINKQGNLIAHPTRQPHRAVELTSIVEKLSKRNIQLPVILRFPQILEDRVKTLHDAFNSAIQEFDYKGSYRAVFPMKVNQRREIVETLIRSGAKYGYGLEVGSKAELLAAIPLLKNNGSLLICNGFKDEKFLSLAMSATALGKQVVIVIEELSEVPLIVTQMKTLGVKPLLGIRCKLYSRGSGRWEGSGGEEAKYGLTTTNLLKCIELLKESGLIDQLVMLHFHIGSQITEIKRIQHALREAGRVYSKIKKRGVNIEYLNVGGGLGVDYDGSKTSFDSSANYTTQEYANNVVYTINDICKDENVTPPVIISESGRAVTAYHSMVLVDARNVVSLPFMEEDVTVSEDDASAVCELHDVCNEINNKNYREYYHDALDLKQELLTLFNLGHVEITDRSKGEVLFWEICRRAVKYARQAKLKSKEFEQLEKHLSEKYICNFSLFNTLPDSWAIDQLFPIMPVHKLNEKPDNYGTLSDVTCDSDGKVNRFIGLRDVKDVLELHKMENGNPYYLGIFLCGAYQDVMGDFHNLFGNLNEAHVTVGENGDWHIEQIVSGHKVWEVLSHMRYKKEDITGSLQAMVKVAVKEGSMDQERANTILTMIEKAAEGYTYLEY